jgi:hypothetical protein
MFVNCGVTCCLKVSYVAIFFSLFSHWFWVKFHHWFLISTVTELRKEIDDCRIPPVLPVSYCIVSETWNFSNIHNILMSYWVLKVDDNFSNFTNQWCGLLVPSIWQFALPPPTFITQTVLHCLDEQIFVLISCVQKMELNILSTWQLEQIEMIHQVWLLVLLIYIQPLC